MIGAVFVQEFVWSAMLAIAGVMFLWSMSEFQEKRQLQMYESYILTMRNLYAVPEKKVRIQSFKYRLPFAADFFIVKFINRLEFFYCIVSKIWYSKYDNQSVCVNIY